MVTIYTGEQPSHHMTVDPFNRWKHHAAVVTFSLVMAGILWVTGHSVSRILGAIPWILLFLVMAIGPLTKLRPSISQWYSGNFPLNWRSELGIWFVIWSLIHVGFIFDRFGWDIIGFVSGMSPWAFAAILGVILAVILGITSNVWAYRFMGPKAWKWHQSHGTYVMFYLLTVHVYDQTFLRNGLITEDPLHIFYAISIVIVVGLHIAAFIKVVAYYHKHDEYPSGI